MDIYEPTKLQNKLRAYPSLQLSKFCLFYINNSFCMTYKFTLRKCTLLWRKLEKKLYKGIHEKVVLNMAKICTTCDATRENNFFLSQHSHG